MTKEPAVIVAIRLFCEFVRALVAINFEVARSFYLWLIPPEPKDVSEDVVLITGAGHGIGREVALRFGRLGATIICVDINGASCEETAKIITEEKGKAVHYVCDVTNRTSMMQLADKVENDVGEVSILLNNAGVMPCKPLLRHSEKEIRDLMDINVNGVLWGIQAFLPNMLKNNRGHIASISSMAGQLGFRNIVPYCGSKFAVKGIMEALAIELLEDPRDTDGIKLTTIFPSMVNTGLCKNPRIRFDSTLTNMVEKDVAADAIVDGIRREYLEVTIPSVLYYTVKYLLHVFPLRVSYIVNDFLKTGLEAHD